MAESPLSTAQPVPNVLPDFSFLPLFFLLENARCIEYSGHFSVSRYSSPMMMLNGKTPTVLSRLPGSDSLPVSHFFVSTHENWSSPLPLPHSLTDVRYKRNPIGYGWIIQPDVSIMLGFLRAEFPQGPETFCRTGCSGSQTFHPGTGRMWSPGRAHSARTPCR